MPRSSLQFHACPEELVDWATEWTRDHKFFAVMERYFSSPRCVFVENANFSDAQSRLGGDWDEICLSRQELKIDESAKDSVIIDTECLVIQKGKRVAEGLREAVVGAYSEDKEAIKFWRKIIANAKSRMLKGAEAFVPYNDEGVKMPSHRFSPGALQCYRNGETMLAGDGWVYYELDDPDEQTSGLPPKI